MDPIAKKVTPKERAAILGSLSAGVVPGIGLRHIQVGRKDEVAALLSDLARVEQGGSAVRFVVGRFGAGKSFFLNLVKAVALERKFVVLSADITTQRRPHGSSGEGRALFGELMKNLATRGKPEGGALANLVERWVSEVAHEVKDAGGTDEDVEKRLVELCKPLSDLVNGYDFATVLTRCHRAFLAGDDAQRTAALRWLRAEYSTKTEARKELDVRSIIDDSSFYDYLKLMAAFVRIAGYAGLLVNVDELVVLSHRLQNKIARNNNYEALLRIINDCLQGGVEGLGFVFGATDECVFDKRRGLFSYEALETRLASNRFATGDLVDRSGPVLKLDSLTPEDCYVLLLNIRAVHAGGDPAKSVLPEPAVEAYLTDCQRRMGATYFQTPRETVKDFVGLLSVLEQNPGADWKAVIAGITTDRAQTVDPSEAAADGPDDGADDLATLKL